MPFSLLIETLEKEIDFDQEEFSKFSDALKVKQLAKNEIWQEAGQIGRDMGFVNRGILRQFYVKEGQEYTDLFFAEGEFIGNYISYLQQQPAMTSIQALEPCEVLVMSFQQLQAFYQTIPKVEQFGKMIGDQKLFDLNERMSALLMHSPEERYYDLLKKQPEIHTRVPQYYIAQYLGIRPESLSRIRKRQQS